MNQIFITLCITNTQHGISNEEVKDNWNFEAGRESCKVYSICIPKISLGDIAVSF